MTSTALPFIDRSALCAKLRRADPLDCRVWLLLLVDADPKRRVLITSRLNLAERLDLPVYAINVALGRLIADDWIEVEPHVMPNLVRIHLLLAPQAQPPPPERLPVAAV